MANQVQYGLFQYTDELSRRWTIRCDREWGANPDSGLGAWSPRDARFGYFSKRYHPRYAILQDPVTGRVTRRICGTNDCMAYAGANAGGVAGVGNDRYELSIPVMGGGGNVTYQRIDQYPENRPAEKEPRNFPESTA